MTNQTITAITLSGRVVTNRFAATAGDIDLFRRDDRSGAQARYGRHTNYGYSGYFLASVFDGSRWRKLQFNDMVPYEQRSYEQTRESAGVARYLAHIIAGWRGYTVRYDAARRSFR